MSAFKTTHDERVEMLREETPEAMNGMWFEILLNGTEEAIEAFRDAAIEAGWTELLFAGWRKDDA